MVPARPPTGPCLPNPDQDPTKKKMDALRLIDNLMERMARLGRTVSSGLLLAMVILINIEVIGRYFLGFSTLIADEYSAYFFVGCTFLGFIYSFRKGHFLRVNIVMDKTPPRLQKGFHCAASFLGCILSAVVTFEAAMLTRVSLQFDSVSIQPSATPLWLPQVLMPIGMGALTLLFLNEGLQTLASLLTGKSRSHQGGEEVL